jgi:hypothetical protein
MGGCLKVGWASLLTQQHTLAVCSANRGLASSSRFHLSDGWHQRAVSRSCSLLPAVSCCTPRYFL